MRKTKLQKIIFLLVIIVGITIYYNQKNKSKKFFIENIEALANGEGDNKLNCYGVGAVDCEGAKVRYAIQLSLPLPVE